VGSAGISLSGGQKQRLALARALYARNELVILDDIFSGLDAGTEEHIFNKLLGKSGLFRQLGTTVLLATHAVHRLSYSDHVIAMSGDGRIVEQGSFEQLRSSGGYVQSLAARIKSEDTASSDEQRPDVSNGPAAFKSENEEEIEELNRQTRDFAVYTYYFGSIGWVTTAIFFAFVVLYGVASKMTEFLITFWTKAITTHGNEVNGSYIGLYAMLALLGLLGLVLAATQLALTMYVSLRTSPPFLKLSLNPPNSLYIRVPKSAEVLHERLLNTVMAAPLSFFT